jgi:hypothetical protein
MSSNALRAALFLIALAAIVCRTEKQINQGLNTIEVALHNDDYWKWETTSQLTSSSLTFEHNENTSFTYYVSYKKIPTTTEFDYKIHVAKNTTGYQYFMPSLHPQQFFMIIETDSEVPVKAQVFYRFWGNPLQPIENDYIVWVGLEAPTFFETHILNGTYEILVTTNGEGDVSAAINENEYPILIKPKEGRRVEFKGKVDKETTVIIGVNAPDQQRYAINITRIYVPPDEPSKSLVPLYIGIAVGGTTILIIIVLTITTIACLCSKRSMPKNEESLPIVSY